ncbi:MAG: PTS sugar transporter subunit IIC [Clostridiales bacterium]|nr:PTS sugar transporter subunit IIC [Clostridiales bacterium]
MKTKNTVNHETGLNKAASEPDGVPGGETPTPTTTTPSNAAKNAPNKIVGLLRYIFIDGLSGMAIGLFATLIIGTILKQIGDFIPGFFGQCLSGVGRTAQLIMGAGIGLGMAYKLKRAPLVSISAGVAGMLGAHAKNLLDMARAGTVSTLPIAGAGEPFGAFIAAFVALEAGALVSNKTKVDIIVTPLVAVVSGAVAALLLGYPINAMMSALQNLITVSAEQAPYLMAVLVAVIMGVVLTLPISSAALGIALLLGGPLSVPAGTPVGTLVAGAAAAGCCAHMVGYAVMSFRENKWGGLIAQGLGTSMLQMPNLVRRPVLWLPPVLASAILGPVSVALSMTCNTVGAGMGTSGLVGCIGTFTSMYSHGLPIWEILLKIAGVQILAPAAICLLLSELMRRIGFRGRPLIQPGDLTLPV